LIINKKYFLLYILIFQFTIYSQTDWVRWEKSDPTYQIEDTFLDRNYDLSIESASDVIVKPVINATGFLFQMLMELTVLSIHPAQVFWLSQLKRQIFFREH